MVKIRFGGREQSEICKIALGVIVCVCGSGGDGI